MTPILSPISERLTPMPAQPIPPNSLDPDKNMGQAAFTMASVTAARLESHEAECARRSGEISGALTRLNDRMDTNGRAITTAIVTGLITLAASILQIILKAH